VRFASTVVALLHQGASGRDGHVLLATSSHGKVLSYRRQAGSGGVLPRGAKVDGQVERSVKVMVLVSALLGQIYTTESTMAQGGVRRYAFPIQTPFEIVVCDRADCRDRFWLSSVQEGMRNLEDR